MVVSPEDILKVVLAVLVGGLIGFEREFRDKAAGFRTMILICVGATLFTIFSARFGSDRTAANIATGVGFIGAGVIMRESGRVRGLTTAAMIWLAAALGMGVGEGLYLFVFVAATISSCVLWLFPALDERIKRLRDDRIYEIVCPADVEKLNQLRTLVRQCGLRIKEEKQGRQGGDMHCHWDAYGSPMAHDRFVQALLVDPEVKEFHF